MGPFTTRQLWEDLCEGVRILKMGAVSMVLRSAEQTSLLNYKIRLEQLDQQLQESYRDLGERLFIKLSGQQDLTGQNFDLTSDERMQRLFENVTRLEQNKKVLLEEMDGLK